MDIIEILFCDDSTKHITKVGLNRNFVLVPIVHITDSLKRSNTSICWRSMIIFESESHYITKWFHSSHFSRCNNNNNYTLLTLGGLSGATSFYINISFPHLKFFLPFSSRAHGARGFSCRIPLFSFPSNIYPSSARVVGFHHFTFFRLQNPWNIHNLGCEWYRRPRRATWVSILDSEQVPKNF